MGLFAVGCLLGCGARSPLAVPDAEVDAFVADAGLDAGPMRRCIEVPRDGSSVEVDFSTPVRLAVVDVMFLLDSTGSMIDEIDAIRRGLRELVVPGVREQIPDAAFGVALVGEFPLPQHGPSSVRPFALRTPITQDVTLVEAALTGLPSWGNFDYPEAHVEGLYQVATGAGLSPWISPSAGCPRGGNGGACFRPEALPLILLITDAPSHNGPPGVSPVANYRDSVFVRADAEPPHGYAETMEALRGLGALVIGIGARDPGSEPPEGHLRAIARDTNARLGSGEPLVFSAGSRGRLGAEIVRAITRTAEGTPLDVDARVADIPGDGFDARTLVRRVVPVDATPASGVERIGSDRFEGVSPGTSVRFAVELDTQGVPLQRDTLRIPARVVYRANGRSRLGSEDVDFVIPGAQGGC